MLSTSGVLVATLVEYFFGVHIDGYVGTIMALFILWTGYGIMKNAVNSILGATPDVEVYKKSGNASCPAPEFMGSMISSSMITGRKTISVLPMWNWTAAWTS